MVIISSYCRFFSEIFLPRCRNYYSFSVLFLIFALCQPSSVEAFEWFVFLVTTKQAFLYTFSFFLLCFVCVCVCARALEKGEGEAWLQLPDYLAMTCVDTIVWTIFLTTNDIDLEKNFKFYLVAFVCSNFQDLLS